MIDIMAIVISFFSLFISIVIAVVQFFQQKMIHQASLNSKYHDEIFLDHLVHKIPEARKYLRFDNETGTLVDTERFTDELNEMLDDAFYYKYKDYGFYKKLKTAIQDIEDYVMISGNKCFEQEEQSEVYVFIQEKLECMYKLINDNYVGW